MTNNAAVLMTHTAYITEIFSSLQGEGLYTGEPTTFVRFANCTLGCDWCDTPQAACESSVCRVTDPDGMTVWEVANPITPTQLNELLSPYATKMLSVTGGEPLQHAPFLAEWLPSVSHRFKVLLETNGTLWKDLEAVVNHVHVVSMDIKLPSSTGCRPLWREHENFLKRALAAGREVYVKIVVTEKTSDKDVQNAIGLVARTNKYTPVIIQPATPTLTFQDVISRQRLDSIDRVCRAYLPNVQVAHQMHKEWNIQ